MARSKFSVNAEIVLLGHILNWPWRSRTKRRQERGRVTERAVRSYLERYIPEFSDVPEDAAAEQACNVERIFSIWLQGEDNAPEIVKACWRSMRRNCRNELVVLDSSSIFDWIELPDHIVKKWREGKIKPAHFTDICRVELLYRYGGLWMDATDFMTSSVPEWIMDENFFVYMCGDEMKGSYAMIQNCFIRARCGNYLIKAWREAIFSYWKNESGAIDYFMHQLLFKMVIECNPKASSMFSAMPKVLQSMTHALWWNYGDRPFDAELFRKLTSGAPFQKTEYKSETAKHPVPGSFSDVMQKMYF